jgi:hypothetical protein
MRFLLNLVRRSGRSQGKDGSTRQLDKKTLMSRKMSANDTMSVKSWGQQCSPNCGCVVRFEATIDPTTQTIRDSSYHAKAVITIYQNGRLEPVYTTRTQKPMFGECKCETLHSLAKKTTSFLPNKRIDQLRNMMEFTFTRSSPALQHAVLVDNGLPRTDTHCFDVLEEALTAMIKGKMPKPRQRKDTFQKILLNEIVLSASGEASDSGSSHESRKDLGIDRTRLSLSSHGSMSTLKMFDINAEYWENEHESKHDHQEDTLSKPFKEFDWVTYVDEQYQKELA